MKFLLNFKSTKNYSSNNGFSFFLFTFYTNFYVYLTNKVIYKALGRKNLQNFLQFLNKNPFGIILFKVEQTKYVQSKTIKVGKLHLATVKDQAICMLAAELLENTKASLEY